MEQTLVWFNNELVQAGKTVRRVKIFQIRKHIRAIRQLKSKQERLDSTNPTHAKLERKIERKVSNLRSIREADPKTVCLCALGAEKSSNDDALSVLSNHPLVSANIQKLKDECSNLDDLVNLYWVRLRNKTNWANSKKELFAKSQSYAAQHKSEQTVSEEEDGSSFKKEKCAASSGGKMILTGIDDQLRIEYDVGGSSSEFVSEDENTDTHDAVKEVPEKRNETNQSCEPSENGEIQALPTKVPRKKIKQNLKRRSENGQIKTVGKKATKKRKKVRQDLDSSKSKLAPAGSKKAPKKRKKANQSLELSGKEQSQTSKKVPMERKKIKQNVERKEPTKVSKVTGQRKNNKQNPDPSGKVPDQAVVVPGITSKLRNLAVSQEPTFFRKDAKPRVKQPKNNTPVVHPSWEASQQKKLQCNLRVQKPEGQKITFDSDSDE